MKLRVALWVFYSVELLLLDAEVWGDNDLCPGRLVSVRAALADDGASACQSHWQSGHLRGREVGQVEHGLVAVVEVVQVVPRRIELVTNQPTLAVVKKALCKMKQTAFKKKKSR